MKKLRLIFNNIDEERIDITLPMEKWIADWWFECNFVPENNTTILLVELDGKDILQDVKSTDERYITFEEIASHFNWDGLHGDFIGVVNESQKIQNSSSGFEKWLKENYK